MGRPNRYFRKKRTTVTDAPAEFCSLPPVCLQLKNADEVEFWTNPEKSGFMHSQGDIVKTWRKRWFVMKDGFLFRFLNADVTPSSKPRGIVDLSKVLYLL